MKNTVKKKQQFKQILNRNKYLADRNLGKRNSKNFIWKK